MNRNHTELLHAESFRIDLFCAMTLPEGAEGTDVTLIMVVDLRAETGRLLCATALGEKAAAGRIKQAARRKEIPSASWPLEDEEGFNMLEIVAPEYLPAARGRRPGQVPVLLVDQDDQLGFCLIDLPPEGEEP